jgi:hypothetical protein
MKHIIRKQIITIPSLRKFPLIDKTHVQKAIQFFKHCPKEHKAELRKNIKLKAKQYKIEVDEDSLK